MNKQEEIKSLQSKIEALKTDIKNCKHIWKDSKYDPETVREGYGYKMMAQGSDVYGEFEGYHDVKKNRWSRECSECGHIQYTNTQEAVKTEYKPKFN